MEKVIFFGGGKFALPALSALTENFDLALVITNPEKPIGRKQIPEPSAIEIEAQKLKLPVKIVEKYNAAIIDEIKAMNPDLLVIVDYGKIIPDKVIRLAKNGAVNVHPSKLPKYRGASPLQSAILNGDQETAISIMLIDKQMDHGPILAQQDVEIRSDDTYGSLYSRLSFEFPKLLLETLKKYLSGEIIPVEQNHSSATYTKLLTREDGKIDWSKSAEEIERMVRAYDPWPGTWTAWNKKKIKIYKVATSSLPKKIAGQVLIENNRLFIGTTSAPLEILELQLEGKQKLPAASFINGWQQINQTILTN